MIEFVSAAKQAVIVRLAISARKVFMVLMRDDVASVCDQTWIWPRAAIWPDALSLTWKLCSRFAE
jgi:hypothetical protein